MLQRANDSADLPGDCAEDGCRLASSDIFPRIREPSVIRGSVRSREVWQTTIGDPRMLKCGEFVDKALLRHTMVTFWSADTFWVDEAPSEPPLFCCRGVSRSFGDLIQSKLLAGENCYVGELALLKGFQPP